MVPGPSPVSAPRELPWEHSVVPLELTQSAPDGAATPIATAASTAATAIRTADSANRPRTLTFPTVASSESGDQYDRHVRWSKIPVPAHIVHEAAQNTAVVVAWLVVGFIMTAAGGLLASRAKTSRRVSVGMALTALGVVVLAAGVWYHQTMPR